MGDDTLRAAWAQLVSESDMEAADPDRTYKVATISPSRMTSSFNDLPCRHTYKPGRCWTFSRI